MHTIVRDPMRVRLRLMRALQPNAPQNPRHALRPDRLELALALHEQHPREPERVHAQPLARRRERVRLLAPRHDVHVLEREEDVVRRGARGVGRVVPHGLDREVEQGEEGVGECALELVERGGGEGGGQAADVVGVGEGAEAERAACEYVRAYG